MYISIYVGRNGGKMGIQQLTVISSRGRGFGKGDFDDLHYMYFYTFGTFKTTCLYYLCAEKDVFRR